MINPQLAVVLKEEKKVLQGLTQNIEVELQKLRAQQ